MKILLAEDNDTVRMVLRAAVSGWGHEIVECADGTQAWESLQRSDAPRLAVLDWMMPGVDGPEICRRLRKSPGAEAVYVILLTRKDRREDIVEGLDAGANDYVTKPFDHDELRARLMVGVRIGRHSEAQFSHSICPECYEKIVKPELNRHRARPR